jgi:hypothetical protein
MVLEGVFAVFGLTFLVLMALLVVEVKKQRCQPIPLPKSGRYLQRLLAQSRVDHPGWSESWHWRNAKRKIP